MYNKQKGDIVVGFFNSLFSINKISDDEIISSSTMKAILQYCCLLHELKQNHYSGYESSMVMIYPCLDNGEIEYSCPTSLKVFSTGNFDLYEQDINSYAAEFAQKCADKSDRESVFWRTWDNLGWRIVNNKFSMYLESAPIPILIESPKKYGHILYLAEIELRKKGLSSEYSGKSLTVFRD